MKVKIKYIIASLAITLFFIPFGFFVYVYRESYDVLKNTDSFKPYLSTKLYDINGQLISELFDENRDYIEMKNIPSVVKEAFLAAEDQNFYKHPGIDFTGIARALIVDLASGNMKQGGSTITQQLVKQLYTKREKTLRRKATELLIAREFERRYDKDKIFEMYLNQIYFGHGVYGIDSASRFYFDTGPEKLDIVQATLLAAIPSAPNRYSPILNPKQAFERHRKILYNAIYSGAADKGEITEKFNSFWAGYLERIREMYPTIGVRNRKSDRAPHFTEHVRRLLVASYGEEKVYRGGLKVHTTLDLRHQEIATEALQEAIDRENRFARENNRYRLSLAERDIARNTQGKKGAPDSVEISKLSGMVRNEIIDEVSILSMMFDTDRVSSTAEKHLEFMDTAVKSSLVEGAFVAIDPRDGKITAMVGGSESNYNNQLNRAVQSMRQPGSAFKAFIYGSGIESGLITLGTPFEDIPVFFKDARRDKDWSPSNYGKTFFGKVLPRGAFASSLNVVSVLIYQILGGARIVDFASSLMDVPKTRFQVDPTLALGTTELSPLEMARGFAVFSANGMSVEPFSIRYILSQGGEKIFDGEEAVLKKRRRIISAETAYIMGSIMRSVVDYGTGYQAIRQEAGFTLPAAGKTGTNSDFRDAWFVGFTPDLVASVWLGCDSQKFTLRPGRTGADAAAPVWGKFMKQVYQFRERGQFPGPPGGLSPVSICGKTGKLAVEGCPSLSEYFINGTVPREVCKSDHGDVGDIFGAAGKKRGKLVENMTNMIKKEESGENNNGN